MRKFLTKTILTLVLLTILYIPTYCVMFMLMYTTKEPATEYLRTTEIKFNEIDEYKDIDILFVGSSHSSRSFDPRIFSQHNLKTFNIGTLSQTCMQSWFIIDRYIDSLNPKCVIIDLYPDLMNTYGEESAIDFINSDFDHDLAAWEWTKLKMAMCTKNTNVINEWIYRAFRRHILHHKNQRQTFIGNEIHICHNKYIRSGFVEKDMKYYDLKPDYRIDTTCRCNAMQMMFLNKTVELLKKRDINYLLVEAPVPSVLYKSYDNHEQYSAKISEYGTFIDYNTRITLNDSLDFYDSHHLNQNGVVKYDSLLIRDLYELEYISSRNE